MSATINQVFFGDQNDFERVVSRYFPVLFQVAYRRLRNIEDAEDAVQDALLSARKCIGQFQGRSKLSTWLTRIVTNTALMKLRRHSRYEMLPLAENCESGEAIFANELRDTRPNPENLYAKTEMDKTLHLSLTQLTPKLRTAIQMCDLDGIPITEAAGILGVSRNTLKSRVARARKSLNLIVGEAITHRPASRPTIGVNREGKLLCHRRSPARRGATNSSAGLVDQWSAVCTSDCVLVPHNNRILNRADVRREWTEIHYPPQPLEAAAHDDPPNYAM